MTKEEEIITTAETALRKIKHVSKDAYTDKAKLSPTMVYYIAEKALAEIQRLKEKQR